MHKKIICCFFPDQITGSVFECVLEIYVSVASVCVEIKKEIDLVVGTEEYPQ